MTQARTTAIWVALSVVLAQGQMSVSYIEADSYRHFNKPEMTKQANLTPWFEGSLYAACLAAEAPVHRLYCGVELQKRIEQVTDLLSTSI